MKLLLVKDTGAIDTAVTDAHVTVIHPSGRISLYKPELNPDNTRSPRLLGASPDVLELVEGAPDLPDKAIPKEWKYNKVSRRYTKLSAQVGL